MSRTAWSVVLAAGLLAVLGSVVVDGDAAAQQRAGDPAKWHTFWTQMMPVFMHDRCFNCHNKTIPREGKNHDGGKLETEAEFACIGCHTANTTVVEGRCELDQYSGKGRVSLPDGTTVTSTPCVPNEGPGKIRIPIGPVWNARGPDFSEDMRELCRMVKDRKTPEQLVEHVQDDALINFAFIGNKGMDDQSPFSPIDLEPPPMGKPEFVNLLTRWITEAAMACGTDGTLRFDDNVKLDSKSAFGKGTVRNETTAQIRIEKDVATSDLHYDEASSASLKTTVALCLAQENAEVHFKAEGKPDTRYEINILPGNKYRMRFTLGSLEGQTIWSYEENLCRAGFRRGDKLPTELTTPLRFGIEDQVLEVNADHEFVLKGSATIPDSFGAAGVVSSGERKLTWDIRVR